MRIIAIIQARIGSTRLPGKVLMSVNGRPLLSVMIDRVRQARFIDQVVIATTRDAKDDVIVDFCCQYEVSYYRGDQDDVLSRYYEAAVQYKADVVVRLTSDCPLIDPAMIDRVVGVYKDKGSAVDFVSNTVPPPCRYPDGMDVEVFSFSLLQRAHCEAKLPSEREHVTFYMWKTGLFKTYRLDGDEDLSGWRLTLDYPQDFEVIKSVLLHFKDFSFSMQDIIDFLKGNIALVEAQKSIDRYGGWNRAFEKDRLLKQKGSI